MDTPRMHWFDEPEKAVNDIYLTAAKSQGYVPQGCLMVGNLVLALVAQPPGDPCKGCAGDRAICGGRSRE